MRASPVQVYDVELQAGEVVVCDALVGDTVKMGGYRAARGGRGPAIRHERDDRHGHDEGDA